MITETEEVTEALDEAARHWPEERSRGRLLLRLITEGHHALRRTDAEITVKRRAAIERQRGALTGAYDEGYLAELREDWPT
ncbi:hypothetical protein SAMN04487905_107184 [Actinopolyspora xinjiangensis]|uniref:Uncharacterized protein n=2 Tax=Actinopolyspora xinjiangensis TaxID=405564 RepID=A0A1H0UW98_9ACTN|nr:hypothetical protein SAMN04487905_107184 [Actinopolyspora xinjiangensis]